MCCAEEWEREASAWQVWSCNQAWEGKIRPRLCQKTSRDQGKGRKGQPTLNRERASTTGPFRGQEVEAQEWDSRGEDKASGLGREANSRTRREEGTRKISKWKGRCGKASCKQEAQGWTTGRVGFTGKQYSKRGTKTEQRSVQWKTGAA